jgi:hypothetical protein
MQNDNDARNNKSYNKRDDRKRVHYKKRSDKAMHNSQSSLSSAGNFPEEGVNLIPDLLCALVLALALALAQAAGATKTIMSNNMIASRAQPPNMGVRTPRLIMTDITIAQIRMMAILPPSLLQRQREVIAPRNRESRQQSMNSCNV